MSTDTSVVVFGIFCGALPLALISTFWQVSSEDTGDKESSEKAAADRIRATLSQFAPKVVCGRDVNWLEKKQKWVMLAYEFVQVRFLIYLLTTCSSNRSHKSTA